DAKKVRSALGSTLSKTNLIGYDVKSDIKVLKNLGIEARNVDHDVLVAAYLINPLLRVQTLTDLATSMLRYDGTSFEDTPPEDFAHRAPEYIAVIQELCEAQKKALEQTPKVEKLAHDIEWPLTAVLADMEYEGIKLDTGYLRKFSKELDKSISDIEK